MEVSSLPPCSINYVSFQAGVTQGPGVRVIWRLAYTFAISKGLRAVRTAMRGPRPFPVTN